MQNRLSKSRVNLLELGKVTAGQSSADPILVLNSIEFCLGNFIFKGRIRD
jgi:hypothetical protein